jgi:thiamine pyrophosphokinase
LSHLWAELPNGRWQLRATDDFWFQLDSGGAVILSPMGIRQHTVSGDLDARRRAVERIYREALERKLRHAERDEMDARAALSALAVVA